MKNFEEYVAKLWDNVMPSSNGWDRWEEDAEYNVDIVRFATEIAREAFADGAHFGANHPRTTCGDLMVAVDKRYPLPKPAVKYRTAGPDSSGNRWQVRDGITWVSHNGGQFNRWLPVSEVLEAMSGLGRYSDIVLLATLAANPTEE